MDVRTSRWPAAGLLLGFGILASSSPGVHAATSRASDGIGQYIFADGFETGDRCEWSAPLCP